MGTPAMRVSLTTPLELSAPSAAATVGVYASSGVLNGSTLGPAVFSGGGGFGFGATSVFYCVVVAAGGASYTYIDASTGVVFAGAGGLTVLRAPSPAPAPSEFDAVAVAHEGAALTEAGALAVYRSGGGLRGSPAPSAGGAMSGPLVVAGVLPGTRYSMSVHAVDRMWGCVATAVTGEAPALGRASAAANIASATVSVPVLVGGAPPTVVSMKVAPATSPPSPAAASSNITVYADGGVSVACAGLAPEAEYVVTSSAIDSSGAAYIGAPARFRTAARPHVSVVASASPYGSFSGMYEVVTQTGTTRVRAGVVVDTPTAVSDFLASAPAYVDYVGAGVYTSAFQAAGLSWGVAYVAVCVAEPLGETGMASHATLPVAVTRPPTVSVAAPVAPSGFFGASAVARAEPYGAKVVVYVAMHPAAETASDAVARMLSMGSLAYPGAVVVHGGPGTTPATVSRSDLEPGAAYRVTAAVVVAGASAAAAAVDSVDFVMPPRPTISISPVLTTGYAVDARVATTATPVQHGLVVHITPYVVGGGAVYSAASLAASPSSADTHVLPGAASQAAHAVFSSLSENSRYGVVAVATDPPTGRVVAESSVVVKTAALPTVGVSVTSVSCDQVRFDVSAHDLDGPFRLMTAVATSPFTAADAGAMAAAGMSYASGVVAGSVSDNPWSGSGVVAVAEAGLPDGTAYSAVAVAVDPTGALRWAQQPFSTHKRPALSVARLTTSSHSVSGLVSVDHPGEVVLLYGAFSSGSGVDAAFLQAAPGVTSVSVPGAGPRVAPFEVAGLSESATYHLAAVAVSPQGCSSAVAIHSVVTDRTPRVSVTIASVGASAVDAVVDVDAAGVPLHDALLVLLPEADSAMLTEPLVATLFSGASVAGWRVAVLSRSSPAGASSYSHSFGLPPGAPRMTLAAAAMRADGDGDLSIAAADFWPRVPPSVSIFAVASTSDGVSCSVSMSYLDPDAGRANWASVSVSAVPAGGAWAWLQGAASGDPNPVAPGARVESAAGPSASIAYSTSGLSPSTDYDLVAVAADPGRAPVVESVRVRTRAVPSISAAVVSSGPGGASTSVTASLADGTFDVVADVVRDYGVPPDSAAVAVVRQSGATVVSGARFATVAWDFSGLSSNTPYYAVFVLVDNSSGAASASAHARFTTACVPPTIRIVPGGRISRPTTTSFHALVRDTDSAFTVAARAFPAGTAVDSSLVSLVVSSPDFSAACKPSSAESPLRIDIRGLAPDTDYTLVAVAVDAADGARAYDVEDFRTSRAEDNLSRAEYDGEFSMSWRRTAAYSLQRRGARVGNSKLSYRVRLEGGAVGDADDMSISARMDFHSFGGMANEVSPGFSASGVSLYAPSTHAGAGRYAVDTQTLDMRSCIVRSAGVVSHPRGDFRVEHDSMPLRQLPMCVLNMYRITALADVTDLDIFHEVAAGRGVDSPTYDSVTINDPVGRRGVPVLRAEGAVRGSSHSVAAAVLYLFDTGGASVSHCGYNSVLSGERAADTHNVASMRRGDTIAWATLSAHATSSDFPRPRDEITRLLLHAASGARAAYSVALRLRLAHVSAWDRAWGYSVNITPKPGITAADEDDFLAARRALRCAQFRLYMNTTDAGGAVGHAAGPAPLPDTVAVLRRDLWLLPSLIFTRPRAVRAMLEARHDSLQAARAVAAAHGLSGARFTVPPSYPGSQFSSAPSPYWDVGEADCVFASAVVASVAWDYFRVTVDRDWLYRKGYPIISSVADYVCSVAVVDPASGRTGFPSAIDISGQPADDPCLTVVTCKYALRAAIEACYELRLPEADEWMTVHDGIALRLEPASLVVEPSSSPPSPSYSPSPVEPLVVLHPYYIGEYLRTAPVHSDHHTAILANAARSSASPPPALSDDPYFSLLLMSLYGQVNRNSGAYSATVQSLLLKAVADSEIDVWGEASASRAGENDIALSGMLVLSVLSSLGGVHVSGGVARSGFYYQPMGVRASAVSVLPRAWKSLSIKAGDGRTWNVINSSVYP